MKSHLKNYSRKHTRIVIRQSEIYFKNLYTTLDWRDMIYRFVGRNMNEGTFSFPASLDPCLIRSKKLPS